MLFAALLPGGDLRAAVLEFAQMAVAGLHALLGETRQPSPQQHKPKSKDRGMEMDR